MTKTKWNDGKTYNTTETINDPGKMIKLPIGIQDFETIRNNDYLYVDKTEYVYKLAHSGKPYFLSRPRRFGKSLLLSTLAAYWEGKKELFKGLNIEALECENPDAWIPHPVLYFDFNKENYLEENALENVLNEHLRKWEDEYGCTSIGATLGERFRKVIEFAYKKRNRQVVILVDEYDKPLLEADEKPELLEHNKSVFKGFFSTLKSYDKYLQFVFVTGVTKFSKVSIFSDLNHLQDISMDKGYDEICGISEQELGRYFGRNISQLAADNGETTERCRKHLKSMYDGYRFHYSSGGIYNPFSIMNAFSKLEYGEYWFETGTPSFLIKKLVDDRYDITQFTSNEFYVSKRRLSDSVQDNKDPLPLLYQTGYLTIKGYDRDYDKVILNYPNDEVKYAFLDSVLSVCLPDLESQTTLDIRSFSKSIETADLTTCEKMFRQSFACIPYPPDIKMLEWSYQIIVYLIFTFLGKYVHTETHMVSGRIDCSVETAKYIYLFEFKVDKSAEKALDQIEDKGYMDMYAADNRKKYKIGVNFSSKEKNIDEWKVSEV